MATTKIWPVQSRIDHVLNYVMNKDKTENAAFETVLTDDDSEVLKQVTD